MNECMPRAIDKANILQPCSAVCSFNLRLRLFASSSSSISTRLQAASDSLPFLISSRRRSEMASLPPTLGSSFCEAGVFCCPLAGCDHDSICRGANDVTSPSSRKRNAADGQQIPDDEASAIPFILPTNVTVVANRSIDP